MSSIEDLLDRYLAGECSPDERAEAEQFLARHPEVAERITAYVDRLDAESQQPTPPDTSDSWRTLRARLNRASGRSAPARTLRWALPIAAAAGLAFAAILNTRGGSAHRYATTRGERSTIRLADGTTVHLAPGTQLRVEAGQRHVWLDGEAFFEVVHNPAQPFTVIAGTDTVRDIGTSYAVRAYTGDHALSVTVREGRVSMTGAGLLGAGDVARIANGVVHVEHGVDTHIALGWVDGHLIYRDAPLAEVLHDASRWYVIDASVRDSSLASIPFTGSLAGLTAHDAVALVAATAGLRATWQGPRVMLEKTRAR